MAKNIIMKLMVGKYFVLLFIAICLVIFFIYNSSIESYNSEYPHRTDIFESDGYNDNIIVNNKTGYLNPPSGVIRRNKYNSKPKTNYKYCGSTCATL